MKSALELKEVRILERDTVEFVVFLLLDNFAIIF